MRRLILAMLASTPLWALSNAVTIQNKAGALQTNRVVPIPRFFADKEICLNPRPYILQSAVAFWQVQVNTRWPGDAACSGGYAQWSIVTVEIPSLASGATAVVEFRSDATSSSAGSGLNKAAVLAASWGAKITVGVGALTASASARSMITSDHYQILESGPLRTVYLVREGPEAVSGVTTRTTSMGFQCTATCVAPYNAATWADNSAYYSMRPSFVVAFSVSHTGTISVETDYLLDNGWMDRAQDQRLESLVMSNGGAETNVVYTAPAAFVFPFRARVLETFWETTPAAINIDFNRAYVTYSKVTPAYSVDLTVGSASVAAEVADFNASDKGVTVRVADAPYMGYAQITSRGASTGGSSPIIGWVSRWAARYLETYDYTLVAVLIGNAKAQMHGPYNNVENRTAALYHTGNSAKAFGRAVSIDARQNFVYSNAANAGNSAVATDAPHSPSGAVVTPSTCTTSTCMVTCWPSGGPSSVQWCSAYALNGSGWEIDVAHTHQESFIPYLITGKRIYLEMMWAMPSNNLAWWYPEDPPVSILGRWGKRGIMTDMLNGDRGTTWPVRNIAMAALMSPDGTPEKAYFGEKLDNNLQSREGRLGITDGDFPPSNPSCAGFNRTTETSIWRMSRCYTESGFPNPVQFPMRRTGGGANTCAGCDAATTADGLGAWTEAYGSIVYGWMRALGYKASASHRAYARYFTHLFGDPAMTGGNPSSGFRQVQPEINGSSSGYLQSWAAVRSGLIESAPLSKAIGTGDTIIQLSVAGDQRPNNLEMSWKSGTYWKIDNEVVFSPLNGYMYFWTSVNGTTHRITTISPGDLVTPMAHNWVNGQMIHVAAYAGIDPGMLGNSRCKADIAGGPLQNDCDFYAKAISANVLELYNDVALTSLVNLAGGVTFYLYTSTLGAAGGYDTVRGALGTTAAAHAQGAIATFYPAIPAPVENYDMSGSHGHYYLAGISSGVDYDESIVPEDTLGGAVPTITARRGFEILQQTVPNQEGLGANLPTCVLGVINCDNPQWAIRPRPLIRNLAVTPTTSTATLTYTAPDGYPCKIGISAAPFTSTDDAGDTSDGQKNPDRTFTAATTPGTQHYRVTCGPAGGAARLSGTFVAGAGSLSIQVSGQFSGRIGR